MSTQVLRTDTFEAWRQKANTVAKNLGEVASIDSRISYRTLTHKGTAAYSVGNTLTGSITGATATVTAVNGVNLVVTPISGTFVGADTIKSRIYFDGTGTLTAGSTITGSPSGATAKVFSYDSGDNSAVVYDITGAFSVGNTISGTSKTITNISLETVSDLGENITNGTAVREINTYSISAIAGINELQAEVGTIASLSGFSATNLVAVANEIKNSAITFNGAKTFAESVNLAATKELTIAGTSVLSSTTLGSGVVNSSLTSVGTIGTGTWQGSIVSSTYGGTGVNNAGRTLTIATGNLTLTTAAGGSSLTLPSTGTVATLAGVETLTNKTVNLASNTLTGTLAQFNTALSDDDFAALAATQTLTNKSIALGSNTITGTLAQFNTALTDDDFAALAATQTLTNKTLSTGSIWQGGVISSTYGGTGVNNGGRTLTINTGNVAVTAPVGGSTLTLPSTGTVATLAGVETLTNKSISLTTNTVTGTLAEFNTALTNDDFAGLAAIQTLTNKSIALGSNTITGTLAQFNAALTDDDFAALAAVQTLSNKSIALGSNTVTGTLAQFNAALTDDDFAALAAAQTLTNKTIALGSNSVSGTLSQFNTALTDDDFAAVAAAQTLTNKSLQDSTTFIVDNLDATKRAQFQVSGLTTATTRTLSVQDSDGTIALLGNHLGQFAATTSAQLAGVISDETGSGALVFATSPSLVTPSLGAATAASINGLTISASTGALTIANGKTLTASNTLTFSGTDGSSVAFGAGGTVVYTSNNITALSTFTSADLAGRLTDETGTGAVVFNSSPSLTTPTIGGGGANFSGSTSGTTNFKAAAAAGTTTITMPAATGTMALTSDIGNGTLSLSTGAGIVSSSASFSANQSGAASYSIAHAVPSGATAATLGTNGISSITTDQFGHITAVTTATYLTAASGVSSITGTANQVIASASVGAVTLSLPQNIHAAAEPTFGGATLGNITVGVSTDNTITTSSGNLILTANGTSTVNLSRPLVANTNLTHANRATLFSVSNSTAAAGADFPYNPTQSTRFSIDSTGNVTINGDLTVAGTTYLPTISGTVAWNTQVTGKTYFGSITDGTTAATPGDGTAFKIRTKDGLTAVVTNDDATHGDNVLFGHGNSITIYGSTSGSVALQPVAVAGTTTITLPAITGTAVVTGSVDTVTTGMIVNSAVTNAKLANSSLTVTAGTGLSGGGSVALGGSVTLNNAGVLSVNSQTGAVTIAGGTAISVTQASGTVTITNTGVTSAASGTGITVTGTGVGPYTGAITITNSDPGSAQAIFKNVAVSGQTTVSAASNTATLNLVGSNITITTDNTTKTVTLTGNAAANNGTITVSAGTGMSGGGSFTVNQSGNTTVTLTNSDPGSGQFIFKNVAVPGQTTIVADSNNDTLTVQAGQVDSTTGIVITTDATTDTLTIAHANTSSIGNTANINGTVIQNATFDTYGHVQSVTNLDLDARYDARYTLAQVTTAGNTTTNAITVGGLTVNGNVTVNGTTTSVNTTTANLKDPIVTLGGADNGGAATSDDAKDRGIEFRWHNGAAAKTGFFGWDRSAQKFLFIPDATNTNEVFSGTKGTIDANLEWADVLSKPSPVVTVTLQGDVSGSASATLSSLGNGAITINTTVNGDAVTLGTDTVGYYVASLSAGSYIQNLGAAGEGTSHTINVDATSGNTASKIVARDGSGGFSAGAVTVTGLTLSKTQPGVSPGKATISFPNTSPGNDPGYIEHEESTSNTGIMRFCVGDDNDTNDYFAFGNSAAGSFAERFKITASGIVTTGTWNGSSIGRSYTDAKIVSVASSGGSISVTDSSGAINVDLPVQGGYSGPASGCSFTVNSRGIITAVSSTLAGAVVDSVGLSFQSWSNSARVWTIMHAGDPSGLVDLYLPTSSGTIALTSQIPTVNNPSITVQGTDGLTGSGTFALNQSSAQTVSLSLPNIVTAGTYNNVTVDAKGRVTAGSNVAYLTSYTDTNTTYAVSASTAAGGAYLDLTAGGSGGISTYVKFASSNYLGISRTAADTITFTNNGVTQINGSLTGGGGSAATGTITLAGTANQVTLGFASGTYTFGLPQSIATTSAPQFASIGVGTAASGVTGNITASAFVKSGGTSSQFLKADGSVDTTAYLSGTVGVANGGTGATTFAAGYLKASGTSAFTTVSSIAYSELYGLPNLPTYIATSATISAGAATGGAAISVNYATQDITTGMVGGGGTSVNLLGGTAITVTRSSNTVTIANTGVTSVTQGTGITVSAGTGAVTITNSGVTSITGTANQVTASASTGGVTLSLPQSINTTANVAFGALDIGSPNPAFGTPTSGEIRAAGNITAYATSDERLKTNIVKIDNALEKVSQIDGIIYDWNDEYKKDHGGVDGYFLRDQNSGVIAQQVEKVFPNVVGERSDGMKAVRYELLVPLLIEAIKDLKAEIELIKANK